MSGERWSAEKNSSDSSAGMCGFLREVQFAHRGRSAAATSPRGAVMLAPGWIGQVVQGRAQGLGLLDQLWPRIDPTLDFSVCQ